MKTRIFISGVLWEGGGGLTAVRAFTKSRANEMDSIKPTNRQHHHHYCASQCRNQSSNLAFLAHMIAIKPLGASEYSSNGTVTATFNPAVMKPPTG